MTALSESSSPGGHEGPDATRRSTTRAELIADAIIPGAVSGLAGGTAFGASIIELGSLNTIASLVRSGSPIVGFAIHVVVAIVIGIGFGLLVWFQRPGAGEILFWGVVYGAMWWFIGAMTLLPLLSGEPVAWNLDAAQPLVASLIGHLAYGAVAGLAFVIVGTDLEQRGGTDLEERVDTDLEQRVGDRRRLSERRAGITRGALVRGGTAGIIGGFVLAAILDDLPGRPSISEAMTLDDRPVSWFVTVLVGLVAGLGFACLYPDGIAGTGPALVRGSAYGLLVWLAVAITLIPLAAGDGLAWTIDDVRLGFGTFPGYLLFVGAVPAVLYHWFTGISRAVTSDHHAGGAEEGVGAQGLRSVAGGAVAGLAGGIVFSVVLLHVGELSSVSAMLADDSAATGFFLHLVTSVLIGVGYGLAFVKRSNDVNSALGWGTSYGVFWWLMGSLTLLPLLSGEVPRWTVEAAADAYPALIGHLIYGAFLGVVFYRLEARHDPWWVSRNDSEANRAQRATEQLSGSAPALWLLTVLVALTVPLLLAP